MNAEPIRKGGALWEALHSQWEKEKRPGYVVTGNGTTYQAIAVSDDDVVFTPLSLLNDLYGSRSTGGISGR